MMCWVERKHSHCDTEDTSTPDSPAESCFQAKAHFCHVNDGQTQSADIDTSSNCHAEERLRWPDPATRTMEAFKTIKPALRRYSLRLDQAVNRFGVLETKMSLKSRQFCPPLKHSTIETAEEQEKSRLIIALVLFKKDLTSSSQ